MDKFKLDEWDVYFELGGTEALASSYIKATGRSVTFKVSKDLCNVSRQTTFKELARHEVCHVLIAELDALIATYVSEEEQNMINERLTVKLTGLLKGV